MRPDFLIVLLPALLLLLDAEVLVAQEIRYEQNTLIRIDSLSTGVALKPEAGSAPDFVSPIDGIPFTYEFDTPVGVLRINEMLRGCRGCALAQGDTGYTIEEIENILRKLLAERGLPIDKNIAAVTDSPASLSTPNSTSDEKSPVRSADPLSRSSVYTTSVDEFVSQSEAEDTGAEIETPEPEAITANNVQAAPALATPQVERETLKEMIARVEKDFRDKGSFTDQRVQFEFDSHELRTGSFLLLNAVGSYMMNNPDQEVLITGNTCTVGPLDYNYRLSELRAESVASYLLSKYPKIDAGQISTEGHGPDNPIANNDDPEVRYLNRRVEFIVKGEQ